MIVISALHLLFLPVRYGTGDLRIVGVVERAVGDNYSKAAGRVIRLKLSSHIRHIFASSSQLRPADLFTKNKVVLTVH